MLIKGCCDELGKPLFTEADIAEVNVLPATILESIFDAILKINRIGAGAVEQAEKN
jgi:hypothetical protein